MILELNNLGKRFNRHWIFRRVNYRFQQGQAYAITGANGSGKSTLLQVIAGAMQHSEGNVRLIRDSGHELQPVKKTPSGPAVDLLPENFYKSVSCAAPYLELIEELTVKELLGFHFRFKPILGSWTIERILTYIQLADSQDKQIRYFSSGMKQRVKLAQAFFSDTPILLLDEPCTNLDLPGIALYHRMIRELATDRLLLVCSNEENEISFCRERINLADYK